MPICSFIGYTLTELFGKPDIWQQIYKQMSLTFYWSNNVSVKNVKKKKLLGLHLKISWGSHLCEFIYTYLITF